MSEAPESTALFVPPKPADVLLKEGALDSFIKDVIQPEIDGFDKDLTTAKGRAAVKSFAFKITRTATFLDGLGKEMNADLRKQVNIVDEARRHALTKLKTLRDDFRKPLDEWEATEEERVREVVALFTYLRRAGVIDAADTIISVAKRIEDLKNTVLDFDMLQSEAQLEEATEARDLSVTTLTAALERLKQSEANKAELEKLRAAQAERDRQDSEAKAAAEKLRAEEAKQANAAKRAEEALAAADAALARQRERELADAAARAAEHRKEVIDAAKKALISFCRLSEAQAAEVVSAIVDGSIPRVVLKF